MTPPSAEDEAFEAMARARYEASHDGYGPTATNRWATWEECCQIDGWKAREIANMRAAVRADPRLSAGREEIAQTLERIIIRRLFKSRLDGYTLETSLEMADAIGRPTPPASVAGLVEEAREMARMECAIMGEESSPGHILIRLADALTSDQRGAVPSGWRPIAEAPKDGTELLGWIVHEPDDYCEERFERPSLIEWLEPVDGPFGRKAGWQAQWIGEPTHWQPLPAPPAELEHRTQGEG